MTYDERNDRQIAKLDPVMQAKTRALLEALEGANEDVLITDGLRTIAEQNAEYAKGRTKPGKIVTYVRGGDSFHNWGVAVDLAPIGLFGRIAYWNAKRYETIARIAQGLGFQWGFALWGFDKPHFMYTQGLTIADFKAGKRLKRDDIRADLARKEAALGKATGARKEALIHAIAKLRAQLPPTL